MREQEGYVLFRTIGQKLQIVPNFIVSVGRHIFCFAWPYQVIRGDRTGFGGYVSYA